MLRLLAAKICPQTNSAGLKLSSKEYTVKKVEVSIGITEAEYIGLKSFCKNINGGSLISNERLEQLIINKFGMHFKESLIVAIKEDDMIEFSFDHEKKIAYAKLYVCSPISKNLKQQ